MVERLSLMNWKKCVRKSLWPILMCYLSMQLERVKKYAKKL